MFGGGWIKFPALLEMSLHFTEKKKVEIIAIYSSLKLRTEIWVRVGVKQPLVLT